MPDTQTILPDTEMLKLLYVGASGESITLTARTASAKVRCLVCATLSRRVHSRYVRTLADLPSVWPRQKGYSLRAPRNAQSRRR